jgi:hypothetical protein
MNKEFQPMSQPLDFTGLRALFINCTLKRSPELSHTQGLIDISTGIMEKHGVAAEVIRAIDHDIATGVWPDMREDDGPPTIGRTSSRRCFPPTSWCSRVQSGWATTAR